MTTKTQRIRKNFGRVKGTVGVPNLIDLQRVSYAQFLQRDVAPEAREDIGMQAAFKSVFPITDFTGASSLEFVEYSIGEPKYTVEECLSRGATYEAPVKIVVRLLSYDVDKESGVQSIRDIKEQEIYFGTVPLMTRTGTFIINGTERVVVSQLQRSPGVFFAHDKGKVHASGKLLYSARIIPVRGSWVDLEFDPKDILYVRIDRRRKFPVTTLLKALGYDAEAILREFYHWDVFHLDGKLLYRKVQPETLLGQRTSVEIAHPRTGDILLRKHRKFTKTLLRRLAEEGIERVPVVEEDVLGRIVARDIVDTATGEVLVAANTALTQEDLELLREKGIREFETLFIDGVRVSASMRETLLLDRAQSQEEAVLEIYRRLRPSSPMTLEVAEKFFHSLFFNPDTYDLSEVGRYKMNERLGLDTPLTQRTLRPEDILATVKELVRLKDQQGPVDDIDHLGNRRVRSVGELIENQYRIGLVRMERAIKERMTLQEIETLMPNDLVNPKPVSSVLKEFFGASQLSQFMDQTNPISEVTHKRRLSALGPGGLSRERAGFEVRDVHPTHYGRICPIETPEGPNIGLIVSLSTYGRINRYGFIETPYLKVVDRKVTGEVVYLTASEEEGQTIAQATTEVDKKGRIVADRVGARRRGEFVIVPAEEITYIDVAPNQMVSVSASLIPFLENDDANRALMGSNMQRQAVPLLVSEAPLVGTGMETHVARDSGVTVIARRDGWVEDVDARRLVVAYDEDEKQGLPVEVDIHKLTKYQKSNQTTTLNQRPLVKPGQRVRAGQVLVDGPSTDRGELALGRNVVVAFMPWRGYNFEDAIVVSERIARDDVFTSVHIEEFEVEARDTKLGKEEITRDIPNVGEDALKNLDDSGIVRIGAEVKAGDILVGKVTPKGETQLSPEEKLLRAIFGEKAGDVRDTSLRVPPGIEGVVVDAKVFSRKGVEKDTRSKAIEDLEIAQILKDQEDEITVIRRTTLKKLESVLVGKKAAVAIKGAKGQVLLDKGTKITRELLEKIPVYRLRDLTLEGKKKIEPAVGEALAWYEAEVARIKNYFEGKIERLKKGDELPPGVIKMVKVYVAMKRKLSVGDKMAGRHGNKGVVSCIVPMEDMPYFADGTPVDIVLNPLGVPSRMNVGQILEVHLGWAAKNLGAQLAQLARERRVAEIREKLSRIYSKEEVEALIGGKDDDGVCETALELEAGIPVATPVFDGAREDAIRHLLVEAGQSELGEVTLYDGQTGEPFAEPVTVGVMYMLKLHHLVDDKIHARSTGPYSLVTQQPLGGKAQFGGQRLGEMEVWAMEAYGAAYSLQEFLTVKSDDVVGRSRMYEKIVKGNNFLEAGLPESFNVLVKELQGLCLDIELLE
ncbi:DNA-directed RNA polymerase subunit beta [Dissulfurirhabdus thermomarina]|uniref:DNA-directed RNA polymerase subunit beta n=1 Tax=Dissulfurirhabdus thermomarina TaxID=1765737 RepID=A0A6N9TMP9_DISTH|nr:DNA-directed RNA polymerase subunit beta [Dissulfurirhabdus thermomarina]NDY42328.1 DNA-directed RNA polymerase subunit beta [Dissulfurirhabdus thermomarina]NMX23395.1 DNA-directed RNA polymerase subunit beta [Dissulfurirhabdus thermomarina]